MLIETRPRQEEKKKNQVAEIYVGMHRRIRFRYFHATVANGGSLSLEMDTKFSISYENEASHRTKIDLVVSEKLLGKLIREEANIQQLAKRKNWRNLGICTSTHDMA